MKYCQLCDSEFQGIETYVDVPKVMAPSTTAQSQVQSVVHSQETPRFEEEFYRVYGWPESPARAVGET